MHGYIFIDKTEFIREFISNPHQVNIIMRPRKFGKTMQLQMLETFLSLRFQTLLKTYQEFFERSLIGKNEPIMRNHFRQHPVLILNLEFCSGETWIRMREQIKMALIVMGWAHIDSLRKHIWPPDSMPLKPFSADSPTDDLTMASSLDGWTKCLHDMYGKRAIVLVDSFDTPLNHAFRHGFHSTASVFFKDFYSLALKGNRFLEKACIVGNVEATESIFSTFDNVNICPVTSEDFSRHFGFTDAEALACIDEDQALLATVKKCYGGNHIGSQHLINPWSFMNWLLKRRFKSYWTKHIYFCSLTTVLKPFIKNIFVDAVSLLYTDCPTTCVTVPGSSSVSLFADTSMKDADSIFHFLVHLGYLTFAGSPDQRTVCIPNEEVRCHWQTNVMRLMDNFLYRENVRLKSEVYNTLTACTDPEGLKYVMNKIFSLFLFHFKEQHLVNEKLYLRFFFGCFAMAVHDGKSIIVQSFTYVDSGRFDMCIKFRHEKRALVFDLRRFLAQSDVAQVSSSEALLKLHKKHYAVSLKGYNCLLIGGMVNETSMLHLNFVLSLA